jgi:hypothetical protein
MIEKINLNIITIMNEQSKNPGMKNKMTMYIVGAIIAVIVVIGGIWYIADMNQKADNKKKEDERISLENKQKQDEENAMKMEQEKAAALQKQIDLASTLAGKSFSASKVSLLTPALIFQSGQLDFATLGSFTLNIKGLDLAILGNTALKVGEVYPTVSGTASGLAVPDGASYNLNVSSLQLQFLVGNTVVDETTSAALIQGLAQAGLIIPTASVQSPIVVNATVEPTDTGLNVKSTPSSTYLFNFEGSLLL